MIWLAIALGLACFVLYKVLIAWDVTDDAFDEHEEDDVVAAIAQALGYESHNVRVLRRCDDCEGVVSADDGDYERDRWLCADCLVDPGELGPRVGNVIRLDDRRKAG